MTWEAKPLARPALSSPAIIVSGDEMLIQKMISFPLSVRQQQPTGSNLAFFSVHVSPCCIVVGCIDVGDRTFEHCSKLVRNTVFFFGILKWFYLISNLSRSVVLQGRISDIEFFDNISLFWSPPPHAPPHLTNFGHGVFPHPV